VEGREGEREREREREKERKIRFLLKEINSTPNNAAAEILPSP
jgi:hypothetical protein